MIKKKIGKYYNQFKKRVKLFSLDKSFLDVIESENKKKAFLIGTPTHGNLGDQAIAKAETEFLKANLNDYRLIEISFDDFNEKFKAVKKGINEEDVLFLHGGGNFGDEYKEEEMLRRIIIKNFPSNKIIIFPQTIFFKSQRFLKASRRIYNKHDKLFICAREKLSFNLIRKDFENAKVLLMPDIVLYLSGNYNHLENKYIMTCLRSDIEGNLSENDSCYINKKIEDCASSYKLDILNSDTVVKSIIAAKRRDEVLQKKFFEFQNAKLVVTDRLHGMIFAFITKTPCIVFSNYNHKVKGVYEWIKKNECIKFLENIDEFDGAIIKLLDSNIESDTISFKENFDEIIKCVKGGD